MKCQRCSAANGSSTITTATEMLRLCNRCADAWWAAWLLDRANA